VRERRAPRQGKIVASQRVELSCLLLQVIVLVAGQVARCCFSGEDAGTA